MSKTIPITADIREWLRAMTPAEIDDLSIKSKVPRGTIMNIRSGHTVMAGLDTVAKFYDYLPKLVTKKKVVRS